MSFKYNEVFQMSMEDSTYKLTERENKILKNTWATTFFNEVFSKIDESIFVDLYSSNPASRPNTPVNVIVGLLILKEMFNLTDDQLKDSLIFDVRYQVALGTTSFREQPVSKNTFTNFRNALNLYEKETGIDLLKQAFENNADLMKEKLNIDGETYRMDSLMVSSSCKKLSRLELFFNVVAAMVAKIAEINISLIEQSLKKYLEKDYKNKLTYYTKNIDISAKMQILAEELVMLKNVIGNDEKLILTEEYVALKRLIEEQIEIDENNKVIIISAKEVTSTSMQNPTDKDATYRKKSRKSNIGYTGNIKENFDQKNAIITEYDLKQNTYSDQSFSKDVIENKVENSAKEHLLVDGAYYSEDINKLAKKKNIELVPTNLVGKKDDIDTAEVISTYEVNEETDVIEKCPAGIKPLRTSSNEKLYLAKFDKDICNNCPKKNQCGIKISKKQAKVSLSKTKYARSKRILEMTKKEYVKLASKRAGVEGIPSVLRRKYRVDSMPIRGKVRVKLWFGFKVWAINCRRMVKALQLTSDFCKIFEIFKKNIKPAENRFLKNQLSVA